MGDLNRFDLTIPLTTNIFIGFGEQLTQEIKCPQGKNTTPTWLDRHVLQMQSSFIR